MNKTNGAFLALYKEYESLVRENGKDPKEYEESLPDSTANKLKMCRQFRNFLAHDADEAFLTVGQGQISFMEKVVKNLRSEKDTLKKHAKSISAGACSPKDRVTDAIEKMVKLKTDVLVVYDAFSEKYSVLSIFDAAPAALSSKTTRVSDVKTPKGNLYFDTADREFSRVEQVAKSNSVDAVVITKDGTPSSQPTGIAYIG